MADKLYENASMEDIRKDIEMLSVLGRPIQDMFLAMVDRAHELGAQADYRE